MLKVKNLNFAYEKKHLLKNINLELEKGDFLGILGPNGSGKSTLLKNLLKNLAYESGEVFVLDKNLKDFTIKEFAKISGFVPQNSQLRTPLKVIDVLLMGEYLNINFFKNYDQNSLAKVQKLAKILKLEKLLERDCLSLSGGEFQRVLLGRTLLKEPQILFLDEPNCALDLNYAIEFLSLCADLIKEKNIAVVAVLHDLNLASLFCNKICFLKNGTITHKGSVKELFTKEILKEIYGFDCEVAFYDKKPFIIPLKEEK